MSTERGYLPPITSLKCSLEYILDCAVAAGVITEEQAKPIRLEVWSLPIAEKQEVANAAS